MFSLLHKAYSGIGVESSVVDVSCHDLCSSPQLFLLRQFFLLDGYHSAALRGTAPRRAGVAEYVPHWAASCYATPGYCSCDGPGVGYHIMDQGIPLRVLTPPLTRDHAQMPEVVNVEATGLGGKDLGVVGPWDISIRTDPEGQNVYGPSLATVEDVVLEPCQSGGTSTKHVLPRNVQGDA